MLKKVKYIKNKRRYPINKREARHELLKVNKILSKITDQVKRN